MLDIRDRVKEFRRIKASELLDNDGNWRTHPAMQRDTLVGILKQIGIAGALVLYHSERNNGALTLIDGELRRHIDPEIVWPCLITDLNDAEADLLLAVYDPISAMAGRDGQKLGELLDRVNTEDLAVRELLRQMQMQADDSEEDEAGDEPPAEDGILEMALQPFEHYDYILLFFRTTFDFERALDLLAVRKAKFTARTLKNYESQKRKVGIGRAVDGAKALDLLCNRTSESSSPHASA